MQTANIMVRLGGHLGNTVPKYQVTAAEIAVLRAIHGPDSIYDVEPTDDVNVKNAAELQRIREVYAGPNSGPLVERIFPGISARVPESLDEIGLDDSAYKAETRAAPKPRTAAAKKARARDEKADAAVEEADRAGVAHVQNKEAVEDGVADMPDSGLLG